MRTVIVPLCVKVILKHGLMINTAVHLMSKAPDQTRATHTKWTVSPVIAEVQMAAIFSSDFYMYMGKQLNMYALSPNNRVHWVLMSRIQNLIRIKLKGGT